MPAFPFQILFVFRPHHVNSVYHGDVTSQSHGDVMYVIACPSALSVSKNTNTDSANLSESRSFLITN